MESRNIIRKAENTSNKIQIALVVLLIAVISLQVVLIKYGC